MIEPSFFFSSCGIYLNSCHLSPSLYVNQNCPTTYKYVVRVLYSHVGSRFIFFIMLGVLVMIFWCFQRNWDGWQVSKLSNQQQSMITRFLWYLVEIILYHNLANSFIFQMAVVVLVDAMDLPFSMSSAWWLMLILWFQIKFILVHIFFWWRLWQWLCLIKLWWFIYSLFNRAIPADYVRLDQDILSPLAGKKELYTHETLDFWEQIKTPGWK